MAESHRAADSYALFFGAVESAPYLGCGRRAVDRCFAGESRDVVFCVCNQFSTEAVSTYGFLTQRGSPSGLDPSHHVLSGGSRNAICVL